MEISKQQLKIKKVKYQELLCLALDLGCAELSIPALRICVFIECYFKSRLTQTKIHFSIVEKKEISGNTSIIFFFFSLRTSKGKSE